MSRRSEARFQVDGRWYRVVLTRGEGGVAVVCGPENGEAGPLCGVVPGFWMHDPRAVLESLKTRVGMSLEGNDAFSYQQEDPETLAPGVTLREFGRSETVAEPFFARYVVEFGLAFMKAASEAGLDSREDLRPELLALRARLASSA